MFAWVCVHLCMVACGSQVALVSSSEQSKREHPASISQVLGLQACAPKPGFYQSSMPVRFLACLLLFFISAYLSCWLCVSGEPGRSWRWLGLRCWEHGVFSPVGAHCILVSPFDISTVVESSRFIRTRGWRLRVGVYSVCPQNPRGRGGGDGQVLAS